MADDSSDDRTEAPSPKRRRDAREKGNVAKSTEINSVFVLLAGIFMMRVLSGWFFGQIGSGFEQSFQMISNPVINQESVILYIRSATIKFFMVSLPIVGVIMVVGLLANIFQIGFLFTTTPIIPKLEKINPLSGMKKMFSLRSLVEAAKSILKMVIIAVVAYLTMKSEFENILVLCNTSVGYIWIFILNVAFRIVFYVALVLMVLALFDFLYQRHEQEKKMKMTHQEVKEERKQLEGDPQVKARIRSLQREMARRRMMDDVPKATVVVTNPTHLAIALRYDSAEMETPVVVAKGRELVAAKIREIAKKNDIPIVEDKPLARAMYDKIEPGDAIPLEFFNAIAEILAYVYKLKNNHAA